MFLKSIAILSILVLTHSWYPSDCCAETDCKPVNCEEILELPNGDLRYQGIVFPSILNKPSQDKYCHVCYNPNSKQPHCIFTLSGV